MKVLITGAAGFLGHGIVEILEKNHHLRLLDVQPFDTPHEKVVGTVADWETVRGACAGIDAIVIAHMASRRPGVYDTPVIPFDVNVKGTALLCAAAVEHRVSRIALISSMGVVRRQHEHNRFITRDLPIGVSGGRGITYLLTKVCQEVIVRNYHAAFGIQTAIIRPDYITDEDTLTDKYGKKMRYVNWRFTDRRDIGLAVDRALALPDLSCEVFYVVSHPDAERYVDIQYTRQRLGWKPQHDFSRYPKDPRFSD